MAGIIYRTCEFEDQVGQAVQAYQQYITDKHRTLATDIETVSAKVNQFTDLDDLETVFDSAIEEMGVGSVSSLRSRFGMSSRPDGVNSREQWLLDNVNTVVINGKYLMQRPGGVSLAPYRTAYGYLGLTLLESTLTGSQPFKVMVVHGNVVFQDSPKTVAKNLGIDVEDLDTILFMWRVGVNPRQRNAIIAQGIPSSNLYSVMKGASEGNVTTLVFDRPDLITKLRSMGLTTADLTLLMDRDIEKVTIDTQELRPGDSEATLNGPYQDIPYPGEVARALSVEIRSYPSIGEKTNQGVSVLVSPFAVLLRALSIQRTFGGADLIRRTSDKIGSSETIGQAALAVHDTQMSKITSTFDSYRTLAEHFIRQGYIAEEVMAFFGVNADCGVSTRSSVGANNFWDVELTVEQEVSIDNLVNEWRAGTANMNFAGSLLDGISIQMKVLTCEAESLVCQADTILVDLQAEGGVYDTDGGTNVAITNADDVYKVLRKILQGFQNVGQDLAVATIEFGNIQAMQSQTCQTSANISFLNDVKVGSR